MYQAAFVVPSRLLRNAGSALNTYGSVPRHDALGDFVALLSARAIGNTVFFDDTVPDRYRNPSIEEFCVQLPRLVGTDLESAADVGMRLAKGTLIEAIKAPIMMGPPFDNPMEVAEFYTVFESLVRADSQEARRAIAKKAYEDDVLGSKVLLGLVHPDQSEVIRQMASASLRSERHALLSTILTTFRTFWLARAASEVGGLFVAHHHNAKALAAHQVSLWLEIDRALAVEFGGNYRSPSGDPGSGSTVLPMLGTAILLNAGAGETPSDLLKTADQIAKKFDLRGLHKGVIDAESRASLSTPVDVADAFADAIRRYRRAKTENAPTAPAHLIVREVLLAVPKLVDWAVEVLGGPPRVGETGVKIIRDLNKHRDQPDPITKYLDNMARVYEDERERLVKQIRRIWRAE